MTRNLDAPLPPLTPGDVMLALQDLGVLKPGEEGRTLHAYGCTYRTGPCTCPGGPELVFADWDERVPSRWLHHLPERFYARHD